MQYGPWANNGEHHPETTIILGCFHGMSVFLEHENQKPWLVLSNMEVATFNIP